MNSIKHHVLRSHSSSSDESMYEEEEVIEEGTPREAPTSPKGASDVQLGTRLPTPRSDEEEEDGGIYDGEDGEEEMEGEYEDYEENGDRPQEEERISNAEEGEQSTKVNTQE